MPSISKKTIVKAKKKKYTVLIVEDERPLAEAIRIKVEKKGFLPINVRTVLDAVKHFEQGDAIDAVWLDHYLLGEENGLDFVVKLKSNEKWKNVPIFVVSNTASPDKVQSYIRLGVNKYYVKAEHPLDQIIDDVQGFLDGTKD